LTVSTRLLPSKPVSSLDEYLDMGGCRALAKAFLLPREEIVEVVMNSGLRGRGGGGFSTGLKWESLLQSEGTTYLVCNGAEGEPATFKDRLLMRRNPYQLLEGVAIAAYATGAIAAYVAVKEAFEQEAQALRKAMSEMGARDLLGAVPIHLHLGPDEYLFGEEKALMEVLEGKEPMPRMMPPYMHGLFGEPYAPNPTVSNNVETLFNVPPIVEWGPEWFRSVGTERSPGTMVLTLVGDVVRPGVYEVPLGTPLRVLLYDLGGGPRDSRELKAVIPGSSHPAITPALFDTPIDFDSLAEAGSGLGTGFTAYDDTACMVRVAQTFSNFLYVESCGQCNPCKLYSGEITDHLARLDAGKATEEDLQRILEGCNKVTDGQRCYLATAESVLVQSLVKQFVGEFAAHIENGCPLPRDILLPKLLDFDETRGRFVYDERYPLKRPDWTYADEPSPE
jgi:NADH-quinone oxidoreductase subunit F